LKRLGSGVNGASDIKKHPWFGRVDWNAIYNKEIRPPFVPKIRNELDVSCFDEEFLRGDVQSMSEDNSIREKVKDYDGLFIFLIFRFYI
jgi:hypothetical protein